MEFKQRWSNCTDCEFGCIPPSQKIHFRGSIPANILFIGEAAGHSEDAIGIPFVGPSGKLLDELISETITSPYCITNSVACTPWIDDYRDNLRAPAKEHVTACNPRLEEFTRIVFGKRKMIIVALGKVALTACRLLRKQLPDILVVEAPHPSAILRQGEQQLLDRQRAYLAFIEAQNYVDHSS